MAFAGASAADGAFPYTVTSRTLDNGLVVHVVPMPSPGTVAFYTWMAVGSRDELDTGYTGFAHFFEHLMFYGGERYTAADRERAVLRMGADENAWTWRDETVYHIVAPSSALADLVAIEADRFQHLALTADQVRKEAGAVYGELRKEQSSPENRLAMTVQNLAYDKHTYQHDAIGYEADVAAMPGAFGYARDFHERMYRPENTTIILAGDVEPAATLALIEAAYGGWNRGTGARRVPVVEPQQDALRRTEIAWPTPTAPLVELAWTIPAYSPSSKDSASIALLASWLLSPTGALVERLVRTERLAYDVSGGADQSVDPGLFRIDVTVRNTADLERVQAIVREEVVALQNVDATALGRTREHERNAFLTGLSDPAAVADALGTALRRDPDPAALDTFWANYAALGPQDVALAAKRWLVDPHLTVVTLVGPAGAP